MWGVSPVNAGSKPRSSDTVIPVPFAGVRGLGRGELPYAVQNPPKNEVINPMCRAVYGERFCPMWIDSWIYKST